MSDWIPAPEIENVLIILAELGDTPDQLAQAPILPLLQSLKTWQTGTVYLFHNPPEAGEIIEDHAPEIADHFALAAQMTDNKTEVVRDALRRIFTRATVQRVVLLSTSQPHYTIPQIDQYFQALHQHDIIWNGTWPTHFALGMRKYHPEFFSDITTPQKDLRNTIEAIARQKALSVGLL